MKRKIKGVCVMCGEPIVDNVCEPCEREERNQWPLVKVIHNWPGEKPDRTLIRTPRLEENYLRAAVADEYGWKGSERIIIQEYSVLE